MLNKFFYTTKYRAVGFPFGKPEEAARITAQLKQKRSTLPYHIDAFFSHLVS